MSATQEMQELADDDPEMATELDDMLAAASQEIERIELERMLSGPYDSNDAIMSINAGAGGTESQDWASMLQRMFMRWAEKRGFGVLVLDQLPGEEAGIKSVTFSVSGRFAYGYAKAEAGCSAGEISHSIRISVAMFVSVAFLRNRRAIEIDIRDEDPGRYLPSLGCGWTARQ